MRSRACQSVILCLLLLGVGTHWVVLQSAAWVGMVAAYTKQSTLSQALRKTFDGKHPCCLCKVVEAGKKSQDQTPGLRLESKWDCVLSESDGYLFVKRVDGLRSVRIFRGEPRFEIPPVPPPKPARPLFA